MAVRNHEACGGISGDGSFIAFHLNFLDGVDNFLAVLEFIQSGKGIRPVVAIVEGLGISDCLAICQQLHGNAFRLDAVLIVVVFPSLCYRDTGLFRRVGIGDVEIRIGRCIVVHSVLGNGVGDFITIRILRKVRKVPLPAVVRSNGHNLYLLAVGVEANGDGIRAFPVLIFGIVPRLGAGEVDFLRCMAVGNHKACRGVAGNDTVISFH